MTMAFPEAQFFHPGKYALIGAASQLGGVVRMKISLAVILVETTGNIWFVFPFILALSAAKWMGDYFNEVILLIVFLLDRLGIHFFNHLF